MTFVRKTEFWVVVCSVGVAFGCGGDATFDSGVENGTVLADMDEAQQKTYCKAEVNFRHSFVNNDIFCKSLTLPFLTFEPSETDAELQAKCRSRYDECLDGASKLIDDNEKMLLGLCDTAPESMSSSYYFDCTVATVSDLEECSSESLQVALDLIDTIPDCGSLTLAALEDYTDAASAASAQACDDLTAACR